MKASKLPSVPCTCSGGSLLLLGLVVHACKGQVLMHVCMHKTRKLDLSVDQKPWAGGRRHGRARMCVDRSRSYASTYVRRGPMRRCLTAAGRPAGRRSQRPDRRCTDDAHLAMHAWPTWSHAVWGRSTWTRGATRFACTMQCVGRVSLPCGAWHVSKK
jgi:hypothetical protein